MAEFDPARVPSPFREASIDLDAVARNTAVYSKALGGRLVADLGGDAFGHGAAACAATVLSAGAEALMLSSVAEGVALRASGVAAPIAVCLRRPDEAVVDAAAADLTLIASSAEEFARAHAAGVRRLGLRIDTGVGPPGVRAHELPDWYDHAVWFVATLPGKDDPGRGAAEDALADAVRRAELVGLVVAEVVVTMTGTPAPVPTPGTCGCVGAELFGVSESLGQLPAGAVPAMTLWAPVVALKRVPADEGVSYGFTYRTREPSTLALVSLGYGDGVDRASGNVAPVSIGGRRYRLSGRVAMDAHVVDLGADEPPSIGDPAVLFGDPELGHPTAGEWGDALEISSAEVTTRLTARVRRSPR